MKYNDTCIYSTQIVILDSGRLKTVVPLSEYIHHDQITYKYKYFIKNSKEVILRDFLYNYPKKYDNSEEEYAMQKFKDIIIEFESEDEFIDFKNNYMKNIDFNKVKDYGSEYTYAGNTEQEINHNQIEIGLGIYMKKKYINYKKIMSIK